MLKKPYKNITKKFQKLSFLESESLASKKRILLQVQHYFKNIIYKI